MATSDFGSSEGGKRMWRRRRLARLPGARLFRGASRYLPKRLYARSLIHRHRADDPAAIRGRLRLHGAALADGDGTGCRPR